MKELFLYLCGFSVVTSIAVIVAVLLRPVLKKGPSYIRCILWALVFLRLLIPVGFVGIPFSVPASFDLAPQTVSVPQDEIKPAEDPVKDNSTAQDPVQSPVQSPTQDPTQNPTQDPTQNPTQTPTQSPTQTPEQTPAQETPGQSPAQNPTQSPVQSPAQTPTQSPAQTPTQTPANDIPANGDPVVAPVTNQAAPQGESGIDVLWIVSVVWACGVVVLLCYMLASSLLLRYRVRNAIVYDSRIRIIDKDCSPFVSGIFRPLIYVPASVDKKDWPYIIAHENSHIKRFDHVLKPLAFLVLCFYWFNPLIWVSYLLLNKDIEYACDERTVKHMENQDRKAYSLALLSVSRGANIVPAMPLSFGKVSVKERVKRVMNRKIPVWAICLTVIVCVSLSVVIACTPDTKKSTDTESDESNESVAEASESSSESDVELEMIVDYADPAELTDDSLLFVDHIYAYESVKELVKIQVNKEVKNFKFIEVAYDEETTDPYAGETLFEVASLTPDRPFYAKTYIHEGMSYRGISFVDDNGETVCYSISYDSRGFASAALLLGQIPSEPPKQSDVSDVTSDVTSDEEGTYRKIEVVREIPLSDGMLRMTQYIPASYGEPSFDTVTIEYENGETVEVHRGQDLNPGYLTASPDEKQILMNTFMQDAYVTNVYLYDVESGEERKLSPELPEGQVVSAMCWLDNRYFLFVCRLVNGSTVRGGTAYYYDTETDTYAEIIGTDTSLLQISELTPLDGKMQCKAGLYDETVNYTEDKYYTVSYEDLYDLIEDGKKLVLEARKGKTAPLLSVQNPDLSFPDGEILRKYSVENGMLYLVLYPNGKVETGSHYFYFVMHALDSGELIEVRRAERLNPNYFLLSPDGKQLLMSASEQRRARFLYLYDVENIQNRRLEIKLPDNGTVRSVCWLDDRYFLFLPQDPTDSDTYGSDVYYYDTETDVYGKLIGADSEQLLIYAFLPSRGSMQFKARWNNEKKYYTVSYEQLLGLIRNGKELTLEAANGLDAPAEQIGPGGGSSIELPEIYGIFADYADESELNDDSLYFEEDVYTTLVKIWVTEEVKDFKLVTVVDGWEPYAGEVLFEAESLTPDRPFYARTIIGEGFSARGISYVNKNGETVYCQISYDGKGGGPTGFGLGSISGPSESFLYKVNPSLPVYMVTVVYTDGQKQTAEQIIITEHATGKEIQRIKVGDHECAALQSAYVADVTFDGYADLLVSRRTPVSSSWLYAYVWDAETNQLVYVPGFEKLANVALDAERKQILHHGIENSITYYSISVYDPDKKEFVVQRDLYWDWDWYEVGLTCFKENEQKNGKWETVNAFTFSGTTPDPEDPRVKPYYEQGSVWDLGSSKWLEYVCRD